MRAREKRLLALATLLLSIAGFASFRSMPNSEDPSMVQTYGSITTRVPGTSAERVDTLVTSRIEDALLEIHDVDKIMSTSRAGLAITEVRLADWVRPGEVDQVWSRVRSKLSETHALLPPNASAPVLEDDLSGSDTLIAAVVWNDDSGPRPGILQRYAKELEHVLRMIPDTERTASYGETVEEIHVTVRPDRLNALRLTASDVAGAIAQRDSRDPSGRLQGESHEIGVEVDGAIDSMDRLARLPVLAGLDSQAVALEDIADIRRATADPPPEVAIFDGKRGIAIAARMRPAARTEVWTDVALERLDTFRKSLPADIELKIITQQSHYTLARLDSLRNNLLASFVLVVIMTTLLMGWRSSLIISVSIPITVLLTLVLMNLMGVAIHQMSVIGFIVALGMLVDNAIIVTDEIGARRNEGLPVGEAVWGSARLLATPLFASTMTSVLAFIPVAMMPGPTGEFLRAMAVTVILCLVSSYAVAVTFVPALMGTLQERFRAGTYDTLLHRGIAGRRLIKPYSRMLRATLARPLTTALAVVVTSAAGLLLATRLDFELFPMSDRDQFTIQLELPHTSTIRATEAVTTAMTKTVMDDPEVKGIHWFMGTGLPVFYYNIMSLSTSAPYSAEALVEIKDPRKTVHIVRRIQAALDREFPQCQAIVLQMGQGGLPPAPIELNIKGPSLDRLNELAAELRAGLAATPHVLHTRSTLKTGQEKFVFEFDEAGAYRADLDNGAVSYQLAGALEGATGGALVEDTEELPVRVRFSDDARTSINGLSSVGLRPASRTTDERDGPDWVPLDEIGTFRMAPELSEIHRLDGQRTATVQGFITAGVLPSIVQGAFADTLRQFKEKLPQGYSVQVAGEEELRSDTLVNLLAYAGVVLMMMVALLVVSLWTFRGTLIIGLVAVLSIGYGLGALWLGQYSLGFSAALGIVALIGVSINDSILVLSSILADGPASGGDREAIHGVVMRSTRHVLATTFTTMVGFIPLLYGATTNLWPPMSVVIAFGVGGGTLAALFFTPAVYVLLFNRRGGRQVAEV